MKKIFLLTLVLLQQFLFAQKTVDTTGASGDPFFFTREGNKYYGVKDYRSAIDRYKLGTVKDSAKTVANYNLGNAYYRNGSYDSAAAAYANALSGSNADSLSKTWHNLGNAMLKQKQYQEAINSYKQSLKLDPKDDDTRYNLAYAQKMLQAQQQQQQQQQQQNSGGSSDSTKQDQQQQQGDQQQQSDQQQQNDKQNSDKQDQQQQQQKQDPNSMTPQDAQRMLDAMKDEERNTRNNMNKNNKMKNSGYRSLTKDW